MPGPKMGKMLSQANNMIKRFVIPFGRVASGTSTKLNIQNTANGEVREVKVIAPYGVSSCPPVACSHRWSSMMMLTTHALVFITPRHLRPSQEKLLYIVLVVPTSSLMSMGLSPLVVAVLTSGKVIL